MTIIVSPEEREFSRRRFLQSTAAVGAASVLPTGTLSAQAAELLPMLATEWEAGPGAVKWIFRVHQDVVFHDGKTMTADDAYSDKLAHGDRVGGNLDLDGMRVAERWWFA